MTFKLLDMIQQETQDQGSKFGVIILPQSYQVFPETFDELIPNDPEMQAIDWDLRHPNQRLIEKFEQSSIPYLDLTDIFVEYVMETGLSPYLGTDRHLDDAGQQLMGEAIAAWVKDNFIIE